MAAATANRPREMAHAGGRILRTNLPRDLYQIAELVEVCFAPLVDESGRPAASATIRQMKMLAQFGPLLYLLHVLARGEGTGFVWRTGGRVKGNVSLYDGGRHPRLGRGWLIANVAVHPDYQRRGIARALMEHGLQWLRRRTARWAALQVEANNVAAVSLYDSMGFMRYEVLQQWYATRLARPLPYPDAADWVPRERTAADAAAEERLIFERARRGGMDWTRAISRSDVRGVLALLNDIGLGSRQHWVLPDPQRPGELAGALWVDLIQRGKARLSLFLDPALADPAGRRALLDAVLSQPALAGRAIRLETTAGDALVDDYLAQAGFRQTRSLLQMRLVLD